MDIKRIRKTALVLLILFGYTISTCALFYPTVSNLLNQHRNRRLVSAYEDFVARMPQEEIRRILDEARAYNRQHRENYIKDAFNEAEDYVLTHPYDQLLDPDGTGIMGYLEIPKIHMTLSIYHGIGKRALESGCGHVEGTSLPIGGKNCHAVLAAHRGLPDAKLFTDLDRMEVGDEFYLHILDRIYAYRIDRIRVVRPSETGELRIREGRDLVTLLTCTPYGVNTHRLLVRGHRVPYVPVHAEEQAAQAGPLIPYYLVALAAGMSVILVFLTARWVRRRRKKTG